MKRPLLVSLLTATSLAAYPNGSRIPSGNAGEPGAGTPCSSCHAATLNPSSGSAKLTLPGTNTFTAGATQRLTIAVTDSNSSMRKGFQLAATGGTFAAIPGSSVVINNSGTKPYVSHAAVGSTWTVDWTPPSSGETVSMYLGGLAAIGTRQGNAYTASVTLTRTASSSGAQKPAISESGVVNAASFAPGLAPGSWLTIFGSNLAPTGIARSWSATEVASGTLPLALEGTSVKIDGKPAAIAYVSETQLNVLAPSDDARGTVQVEVSTAAGGAGAPVTATLSGAAPGLFRFVAASYRYVAATHADGSMVIESMPAHPGETVLLFGAGFGPTSPEVSPGIVFSGSAPLAVGNNLAIRIGGVAAEVKFAGLSATGLYQFNVVVPAALADGEYPVEASVWGVSVPTQQFLIVRR